jgi:hypothetical protein
MATAFDIEFQIRPVHNLADPYLEIAPGLICGKVDVVSQGRVLVTTLFYARRDPLRHGTGLVVPYYVLSVGLVTDFAFRQYMATTRGLRCMQMHTNE